MERETDDIWQRDEDWLPIPSELVANGTSFIISERRAKLWALVLEARYLPCRIEEHYAGLRLVVPTRSFAISLEELRLYEKENRGWPPFQHLPTPFAENTLATLSVLILLATFHNLTRLDLHLFGHYPVDWVAIGNADAAKILHGQWWRLITALTLHADWLHLISNLTIGGLFIVFLCRELGSGLAWSLLLTSGVLGNLVNASLQMPDHRSVGASTLIFGAVGILAAISMVRYRKQLQKRWPLPVAAAMALLALLGTEGKQTDLGAHLFGFVFGILLGLLAEFLMERFGRPDRWINAIMAGLCLVMVVFAWWAALVYGG
ncbi:MAG TPA: rhomboid family intramembrane serine protease [Geobacteraceae bacterium]|nr:rhomboid family intramembrane serine protease [Geobacteraceae bacterium]